MTIALLKLTSDSAEQEKVVHVCAIAAKLAHARLPGMGREIFPAKTYAEQKAEPIAMSEIARKSKKILNVKARIPWPFANPGCNRMHRRGGEPAPHRGDRCRERPLLQNTRARSHAPVTARRSQPGSNGFGYQLMHNSCQRTSGPDKHLGRTPI